MNVLFRYLHSFSHQFHYSINQPTQTCLGRPCGGPVESGTSVLNCPSSNHGSAVSQLGDLRHVTLLLCTLVLIYKVRKIIAPTLGDLGPLPVFSKVAGAQSAFLLNWDILCNVFLTNASTTEIHRTGGEGTKALPEGPEQQARAPWGSGAVRGRGCQRPWEKSVS